MEIHSSENLPFPMVKNPESFRDLAKGGVEGSTLHIENVGIVDGTPLLDIKSYVPEFEV